MRIGIWQSEGVTGDPAANIARLAGVLAQAQAAGIALLVTPELWTTGYNAPDAIRARAEPADGPSFAAISALASASGVAIAYGYPEQDGDRRFSSAQLVGANGRPLVNYRKLHLWGDYERGLFVPGDFPAGPVDIGGWQVALSICYDTEFPELIRLQALRGAELILAPTALALGVAAVPDRIVPVRALENGVYIAFCNHCGREATLAYHGGSRIVDPWGETCAVAAGDEAMVFADMDHGVVAAARQRTPYLADRRRDLPAA